MTPEDDNSLLSSYLDDELPPEQRRAFESEVATDPALAEQVHDLARVRDLIASLPRPGLPTVDLSASVLRTIRHKPQVRRWGPLRVPLMASGLAAAAALCLAFLPQFGDDGPANSGLLASQRPRASGPALQPRIEAGPAVGPDSAEAPDARFAAAFSTDDASSGRVAAAEADPREDRTGPAGETERIQLRNWLDRKNLRRITLTSKAPRQTEKAINSLLQTIARNDPSYARIRVSQGIAEQSGPRGDANAEVFAVVLRPWELTILNDRLERDFPEVTISRADSSPSRSTLWQLAEAEDLRILPGTSLNPVRQPRQILAMALNAQTDDPGREARARAQPGPGAAPGGEPITLLLWVVGSADAGSGGGPPLP